MIAETSPPEVTVRERSIASPLNFAAITFLESRPRALMTSSRVILSLLESKDLSLCLNCNNDIPLQKTYKKCY